MHQSRPIFTVFGNSYVPESRRPERRTEHPLGPLFVVLIAGLLGLFITAAALTAVQHARSTGVSHQQQPSYFLKAPPTVGFDTAVF
jgi:hypothetical protein